MGLFLKHVGTADGRLKIRQLICTQLDPPTTDAIRSRWIWECPNSNPLYDVIATFVNAADGGECVDVVDVGRV